MVESTVNLAGVFRDKAGNKHTASWLIDFEPSSTKNVKVTGSYKFTATGIYEVQMNVTDQNNLTSYSK